MPTKSLHYQSLTLIDNLTLLSSPMAQHTFPTEMLRAYFGDRTMYLVNNDDVPLTSRQEAADFMGRLNHMLYLRMHARGIVPNR